jgi:hypothetical protein
MIPGDVKAGDSRFKRLTRRLEGWALALALAAGGAVVGFAFSEYRLHEVLVDMRSAHEGEIRRLNVMYGADLRRLAPQVAQAVQVASAAAAVASSAAIAANSAAETAADAADTSAGAAKTARSAAVTVARRPAVAIVAPSTVVPTPAELGRAVDLANRKVKEAGR